MLFFFFGFYLPISCLPTKIDSFVFWGTKSLLYGGGGGGAHSIIVFSQNDQNLDPLPPCSHLFDFGNPLPSNVNFALTPQPPPTPTPYQNNKSSSFIGS